MMCTPRRVACSGLACRWPSRERVADRSGETRPLSPRPGWTRTQQSHSRIGTEQAVDHPVPPGAVAPPGGTGDPLPGEPYFLQGSLLSKVVHLGPRPDAVHRGMREQVASEQALRLRAVTAAPGL